MKEHGEVSQLVELSDSKSGEAKATVGSNPIFPTNQPNKSRYRNWISDETSNLAPQKGIVGSSPTRLTILDPTTRKILGNPRLEASVGFK